MSTQEVVVCVVSLDQVEVLGGAITGLGAGSSTTAQCVSKNTIGSYVCACNSSIQ